MSEFNIASTSDTSVLRDIVALEGGGFAALMQDLNATTRAVIATRIVMFELGPSGGFEKTTPDIVLGSISPSVSILALSDGGVAIYQRVFVSGVGNVTEMRRLDADGQLVDTQLLSSTLGLNVKLDASFSEAFSTYFWRDFDPSLPEFTAREFSDDTGLPTDKVIALPGAPQAAIDGGFFLIDNESFTKLIGVATNPLNDEPPPVFDGVSGAALAFQGATTAGNLVVNTDVPAPLVLVGDVLVQRGRVEITLSRPDGSPPVMVFSDNRDNASFGAVVTEVPGIGFAAFISATDSLSGATIRAEVILFDFAGNILGRADVSGPIGDRSIAPTMRIVALKDSQNEQVRILASWGDDALASDLLPSRQQADLVTFDIAEGIDGFALTHGGTNYGDFLRGLGKKDFISGGAGNDVLIGNGGDDQIFGGDGGDGLNGGTGNDALSGGDGRDILFGQAGDDTLDGGERDDLIVGEEGNDQLVGGSGADKLLGSEGADSLDGQNGNDSLRGDAGADTLIGGTGDDTMSGGDDADLLVGGTGRDSMIGNDGDDVMNGRADSDQMLGGRGDDNLVGDTGDDSLEGGNDDDFLFGGDGNDLLRGDAGVDEMLGGAGNDTLFGGGDSDGLNGGLGRDLLIGGPGADVYIFLTAEDAGKGASRDRIKDFVFDEDQINLQSIDLNFSFITGAFTAGGGAELRYQAEKGLLQGDANGDGQVDFEIELLNKPDLPTGAFLI